MPDQNILVIDDSCLVNDVVRDVLLAAGYGVHQALNGEDALSVLAANSFDLLLIDVEMPKMDGYTLLSRIRTMPRWATTPVLMLRTRDADQKGSAQSPVAPDDYVIKPIDPVDLITRIRAVLRKQKPAAKVAHRRTETQAQVDLTEAPVPGAAISDSVTAGKIITVFSLKGGVGASTIATNLGVALQELWNEATALIDLSLESASLNVLLDILPSSAIDDLVQQNGNLDPETAAQYLARHTSGVSLLAALQSPERAELIDGAMVRNMLTLLRDSFDYVVIDTASNFAEHTLVAIEMADAIVLPLIPDISSVRTTNSALDILSALDVRDDRIFLLLNEIVPKVGLSKKHVESALHRFVTTIPSGGAKVTDSINRGAPLVLSDPDLPFCKSIEDLAFQLSRPESIAKKRSRSSELLTKVRKRVG